MPSNMSAPSSVVIVTLDRIRKVIEAEHTRTTGDRNLCGLFRWLVERFEIVELGLIAVKLELTVGYFRWQSMDLIPQALQLIEQHLFCKSPSRQVIAQRSW